jgi:centrin-1
MKKTGAPAKASSQSKKAFDANSYVTAILPRDDVIEIKQAFDIFDGDGSGVIDPAELKQAFVDLGFVGQNKFVYQILAELDEDGSGGIEFDEFLKLATAKASEKDSRVEINKVFNAFDKNRMVTNKLKSEEVQY